MNKLNDRNYGNVYEPFDEDLIKLYFKILEAYILMEEYNINIISI